MNNFSCSLSCTWMTTIDCLFYASGSLSRDVSREYIANIVSEYDQEIPQSQTALSLFPIKMIAILEWT